MENYNTGYNAGYTIDIPYEARFFRELTPNYLRALLLLQGIDLPKSNSGKPFQYLELGYGQGTSLAIHACSNYGEFWGTDINPEHALHASSMIHSPNACVLNESFAELAHKSKNGRLPMFDMIVLHGVWSWVSSENQQHILDIIANSLMTGGVVYISYNCMPGWSSTMSIRDFLYFHTTHYNYPANASTSKAQDAFALLKTLHDGGAHYFANNAAATAKIARMQEQSLSYIVHEYMNAHWSASYFKDVAQQLHTAKCQFLTSARPLTHLSIAIPEDMQATMSAAHDTTLRETLRDFIHNTQFRCDIYVKGKNTLSPHDFLEKLGKLSFVLLCRPEEFSYTVRCPLAEVECKKEIYAPLMEYLARDNFRPKPVASMLEQPSCKHLSLQSLIEMLTVLMGAAVIHPAQEVTQALQEQCHFFNIHTCLAGEEHVAHTDLASPVLGGGIHVSDIEKAFLKMRAQSFAQRGVYAPKEVYVPLLLTDMQAAGQDLMLKGKKLNSDDALLHLHKEAEKFEQRLPLLHALGVTLS